MTATTPEQIRALANGAQQWSDRAGLKHKPGQDLAAYAAALRAAADRVDYLEATMEGVVEALAEAPDECSFDSITHVLRLALTADTAPREDRDE